MQESNREEGSPPRTQHIRIYAVHAVHSTYAKCFWLCFRFRVSFWVIRFVRQSSSPTPSTLNNFNSRYIDDPSCDPGDCAYTVCECVYVYVQYCLFGWPPTIRCGFCANIFIVHSWRGVDHIVFRHCHKTALGSLICVQHHNNIFGWRVTKNTHLNW